MDNVKRDRYLKTVEHLMNLAMHENTPQHEAELAKEKAKKIMLLYKIEQADLAAVDGTTEDDIIIDDADYKYYSKYMNWEGYLSHSIGKFCDCKTFRLDDKCSTVIGHISDVENYMYFFKMLQETIGRHMKRNYKGVRDRNAYARGCVSRLNQRFTELKRNVDAEQPSNCTALVIVKEKAIAKLQQEFYPDLKLYATKGTVIRNAAFFKGHSDAGSFSLNRGLSGGAAHSQIN